METVLRRYGWAVIGAIIVAVAWFVALALGEVVLRKATSGVDLSQLGPGEIPPDGTSIEGYGVAERAVSMDELLAGNLFELPEEVPDAEEEEVEVQEEVVEPEIRAGNEPIMIPPCPAGMKLIALLAGPEAAPELGFATIEREGRAEEYRIGYDIGDWQVEWITWNRVYLRALANDDPCFMDIRHPDLASAQPATPRPESPPPAVAAAPPQPPPTQEPQSREERFRQAVAGGIEQVSETERNVQRSLIATVLDNQDIAMRQARVMPHEEGGQITGFKVYGIRRDSLFGTLGLENGDLIESVNGIPMTGADKALQAYGRLRMADRISITVTRRGQRMSMDYNIR